MKDAKFDRIDLSKADRERKHRRLKLSKRDELKARAAIDAALRNKDFKKAAELMVAVAFLKTDPDDKLALWIVKKVHDFKMQPHFRNPFAVTEVLVAAHGEVTIDSDAWVKFWERIEQEWAWEEKKRQLYPFDGVNDPMPNCGDPNCDGSCEEDED